MDPWAQQLNRNSTAAVDYDYRRSGDKEGGVCRYKTIYGAISAGYGIEDIHAILH